MKKWKAEINAWEFQNIYIKSDAITVTNQRFKLNDVFTKILNLLDSWEGEGSGWIIEQVQDIHININDYDPLAGSSYLPLPAKLSNPKQGLTNIENKDIKCPMWCHVRLLNLTNNNPQRIKKVDRRIVEQLDYSGVEFPVKEKHYPLIEEKIIFI